jgi:hypothetical protein
MFASWTVAADIPKIFVRHPYWRDARQYVAALWLTHALDRRDDACDCCWLRSNRCYCAFRPNAVAAIVVVKNSESRRRFFLVVNQEGK